MSMSDINDSMQACEVQRSNRIHDHWNVLNSQWNCEFLCIQKIELIFKFFVVLCFSFPIATAAIYVRRFFDGKSKQTAVDIAKNIHEQFIETLKQVPWMDEKSRASAIEKAKAMEFFIGYPDELLNDTLIDAYYKDLELQTDSLLHSMFRVRRFLADREIMKLGKPVIRNDWSEQRLRTTSVNAAYLVQENSICTLLLRCESGFLVGSSVDRIIFALFRLFGGHFAESLLFG